MQGKIPNFRGPKIGPDADGHGAPACFSCFVCSLLGRKLLRRARSSGVRILEVPWIRPELGKGRRPVPRILGEVKAKALASGAFNRYPFLGSTSMVLGPQSLRPWVQNDTSNDIHFHRLVRDSVAAGEPPVEGFRCVTTCLDCIPPG